MKKKQLYFLNESKGFRHLSQQGEQITWLNRVVPLVEKSWFL